MGRKEAKRVRLRSWVGAHLQAVKGVHPALPEFLSDRQQHGAEPLLAIADAAGGDWPSWARAALIDTYSSNSGADESFAVRLLSDIRDVFCEKNERELSSNELVALYRSSRDDPGPHWIFVIKGCKREFFSDARVQTCRWARIWRAL
jgi:putative DNA primase/helicase